MWRYLKEAFWLRVDLPTLGELPVNALAVLGFGIVGCASHAVWLVGVGLETAYLYALATHPRFQNVVMARSRLQARQDAGRRELDLLARLSPESRARVEKLAGKIERISHLLRVGEEADLLGDSHVNALRKLGELHLRLLGIEHDLQSARQQSDEENLSRQAASLEAELSTEKGNLSPALRESKQATLTLMQKRLANVKRRTESLAEVGSDLARIEAQVEVALEEASLEGKSTVAAGNFDLLNRILESNSTLRKELTTGQATVDLETL